MIPKIMGQNMLTTCQCNVSIFSVVISDLFCDRSSYTADSPQILGDIGNSPAIPYIAYYLHCPLEANPHPVCEWSFYACNTNGSVSTDILNGNYQLISEADNCTIVISQYNIRYVSVCYQCTASNYLGTANISLPAIPLNTSE